MKNSICFFVIMFIIACTDSNSLDQIQEIDITQGDRSDNFSSEDQIEQIDTAQGDQNDNSNSTPLANSSNYELQEAMLEFAEKWGWLSYEIQLPIHEYTFVVSDDAKVVNIGYRDYFSGETTHLFEIIDEENNVLFSESINFHSDWGYRGNDVVGIIPVELKKDHKYIIRKTSTNLGFNNIIIPKDNQSFDFPIDFGSVKILGTRLYGNESDKEFINYGIPFITIGILVNQNE